MSQTVSNDADQRGQTPPLGVGGTLGVWLYWTLGALSALLIFCMMALTFFDVLGRYVFNTPIPGAFEVTELMLATLIFAGLPLVTLYGEQVTVDLFDKFIPVSVRHIRDAVISLGSAFLIFVMSYSVWLKADESAGYGDITAILRIPIPPLIYFMSVMLAFTGVVLVIMAWWALTGHDQIHNDKF